MATRKHEPPKHDALPGEAEISQAYRNGGRDTPPSKLDAQILAAARTAVQPAHLPRKRWAVPLSTAAVIVLAVSVVLLMTREGTLDRNGGLMVPDEYGAAPASPPVTSSVVPTAKPTPIADMREERLAKEVTRSKSVIAESAAPLAEPAENKPARLMTAEKAKKAEAPAAAAPAVVGRLQEADRMKIMREEKTRDHLTTAGVAAMKTQGADVIAVQVTGSPGAYSFDITVKSPDTGCQQFADWWEVLSEDGKLLYRRVLLHSHVGEQPFTRDGGPVSIQPDTVVWVRAHMNTSGYGGAVQKGSVKGGFKPAALSAGFAAGVARQPPLPDGCAF